MGTVPNYDPVVAEMRPQESSLTESFIRRARESPRRDGVDAALRTLDIALSLVLVALTAIPMLLIAVAILATSGRPVLYRGQRVGRGGHFYTMLKFRTLTAGAEGRLGSHLGDELVQRTREERTTIGRWLRATQLDELPQLWNILRGDMSLVGPRPIRPIFFEQLASDLPAYWQRLVVRPGLTGFAQVRRGYETSMAEKLSHDLEWIADRSVGLYLRTLGATGWRVVRQSLRGAVRPTRVE
jgi:undecaprenyl-phosphate glucose phosphotransferase